VEQFDDPFKRSTSQCLQPAAISKAFTGDLKTGRQQLSRPFNKDFKNYTPQAWRPKNQSIQDKVAQKHRDLHAAADSNMAGLEFKLGQRVMVSLGGHDEQPPQMGMITMEWYAPWPQDESSILTAEEKKEEILFSIKLEDGRIIKLVSKHRFTRPVARDFKKLAKQRFRWRSPCLREFPKKGIDLELTPSERITKSILIKQKLKSKSNTPHDVSLQQSHHNPGAHTCNYNAFGRRGPQPQQFSAQKLK
jgi:hypothetical protein